MPEKPTIPTTDILENVCSLLEKHPELVKTVLVIPGTSSVEHLRENLAGAELTLPPHPEKVNRIKLSAYTMRQRTPSRDETPPLPLFFGAIFPPWFEKL